MQADPRSLRAISLKASPRSTGKGFFLASGSAALGDYDLMTFATPQILAASCNSSTEAFLVDSSHAVLIPAMPLAASKPRYISISTKENIHGASLAFPTIQYFADFKAHEFTRIETFVAVAEKRVVFRPAMSDPGGHSKFERLFFQVASCG